MTESKEELKSLMMKVKEEIQERRAWDLGCNAAEKMRKRADMIALS